MTTPATLALAPVRRLHGAKDLWRLRVGDYRGIFAIDGNTIVFTRFAHRSDVYKK